MWKGRFLEERMVAIIREGDRRAVGSGRRCMHQRADDLYLAKRFAALQAEPTPRPAQFEAENARLEKLERRSRSTVLAGGLAQSSSSLEPPA